ncbi:lactoylglutathione lyase [Flavobacteriaceae bacterium UJ101]|nr:lactoylglutathione lyase [Flavobacteriaceae bacterium UJ101]
MKIEHIAIWVEDLEKMKSFYQFYFQGQSNKIYHNPKKKFSSYFISFDGECRIELMHNPSILNLKKENRASFLGIVHFAISVGSKKQVDQLTQQLENDGYTVISQPRTTGDGYYESVVLDPENNPIEITI